MATHVERHIGLRTLHRETAALNQRPPLARGERALITERDLAGYHVVASTAALHYQAYGWRRLPWEELGRVRWRDGVLELTRFDGESIQVRLPGSSRLPEVVRDLVGSTELIGTRVALIDGRFATVAARRRPSTGETIWIARLPDGADPADPGIQARVDSAIRELRTLL
jgi:hypothetical protein